MPPRQHGRDQAARPTLLLAAAALFTAVSPNRSASDAPLVEGPAPVATVSGIVWEDMDGDGEREEGEPPIVGMTIHLHRNSSTIEATTTSDEEGRYSFSGMPAYSSYQLRIDEPPEYRYSFDDVGVDETVDTDFDSFTGRGDYFSYDPAGASLVIDAGLFRHITIGGLVWSDRNGNGIHDIQSEPGAATGTLRLHVLSGYQIPPVQGGPQGGGIYARQRLAPGTYAMQLFNLSSGVQLTFPNIGDDDEIDSDADRTTGMTHAITVVSGQNDFTLDFGLFAVQSISSACWEDVNGNGRRDDGEPPLTEARLSLNVPDYFVPDHPEDIVIADDWTVRFQELPPSDYSVTLSLPPGFVFTYRNIGTDDLDSDLDPATGTSETIYIPTPASPSRYFDGGAFRLVDIGGIVWEDLDADGIRDDREPPLAGATVTLRVLGPMLQPELPDQITGADGLYSFNDIAPGRYALFFATPYLHRFSPANQGGNDAIDSDPSVPGGIVAEFAANSGAKLSFDAGMVRHRPHGGLVRSVIE